MSDLRDNMMKRVEVRMRRVVGDKSAVSSLNTETTNNPKHFIIYSITTITSARTLMCRVYQHNMGM